MERQEPTISKPDMQDLHFRPRHQARPAQRQSSNGIIWKVAIGVFIGMSACLLATCALLGVGAAAVAEQREQAQKEAVDQFLKVTSSPDPMGLLQQIQEARKREIEAKALRPGQRCIQGRRLERIDGGWRDLPHEPC